ncbi:unnamed protein product, partial [Prorocentrum cordatum]
APAAAPQGSAQGPPPAAAAPPPQERARRRSAEIPASRLPKPHDYFPFDVFCGRGADGLLPEDLARELRYVRDHCMIPPFPWGQVHYHDFLVRNVLRDVPGDLAELGMGQGGMSLFLGRLGKKYRRKFLAVDSFEGLPPPDVGKDNPYFLQGDYRPTEAAGDNYENFLQYMKAFDVDDCMTVKKAFFKDLDIPPEFESFCFVHMDSDLYDSVWDSLEKVWDRVSEGGCIVIDDFFHPVIMRKAQQGPCRAGRLLPRQGRQRGPAADVRRAHVRGPHREGPVCQDALAGEGGRHAVPCHVRPARPRRELLQLRVVPHLRALPQGRREVRGQGGRGGGAGSGGGAARRGPVADTRERRGLPGAAALPRRRAKERMRHHEIPPAAGGHVRHHRGEHQRSKGRRETDDRDRHLSARPARAGPPLSPSRPPERPNGRGTWAVAGAGPRGARGGRAPLRARRRGSAGRLGCVSASPHPCCPLPLVLSPAPRFTSFCALLPLAREGAQKARAMLAQAPPVLSAPGPLCVCPAFHCNVVMVDGPINCPSMVCH